MNKRLIKECLVKYDASIVEKHLIYSFLSNKSIDFSESSILANYFDDFDLRTDLFLDISSLNINSIKELEKYLELTIPIKDRKYNGAFFTPTYIVDFIISELSPKPNDKCLDPSCGSGAFLIGLATFFKNKFSKPIKKIVKENIYGVDILPYNIRRAKLLLTIFALLENEFLEEDDFNLFPNDSLRIEWDRKFNIIVGNPPYVKFQDLTEQNRKFLLKKWATIEHGTFNLYFAFFELGYKLLTPDGKLGFITPNNYFTSFAGESLRKFFHSEKCVFRIADFNHKKVFDVQTYTAITFLNKKTNNAINFDRILDGQSPEEFLSKVNGSPNFLNDLNFKKWRLLKSEEQENIKIIESIGESISNLFEINVGIATLKDELFFIDGTVEDGSYYLKETDRGDVFKIEKAITKPVYKISDFKNQNQISQNSRRIICPFKITKNSALPITEEEMKWKYPFCYEYFLAHKEDLSRRDKGKKIFNPFYTWGRTQGLTKKGKKLLTPTFSKYPKFLLVEDEEAFFTNGYGIYFKKNGEDNLDLFVSDKNLIASEKYIDVVQKILNSYIMHYYVSKTSVSIEGGYPCYQKNFIEKFTIPNFSKEEIHLLRKTKDINQINEFLVDKYHLKLSLPNLST